MTESTIAWVFPGQGSQEVGMGRDLHERFDSVRALYALGDEIAGRSISRLCFEGPVDELSLPANNHAAMFITSIACLTAARETGALAASPSFVAGHSLGEYSALVAAGSLTFEDGVRLVEERGRQTQAAADASPGGMAAVLGLDETAVAAVCDETGAEISNINAPGQIVIGGATAAVDAACKLASERGARRAIRLEVGGAFHTSLMQPAADAMREVFATLALQPPATPFVANDAGRPLQEPRAIAEELRHQLTHPVRWVQCVDYMAAQGTTKFIEIGPGRVLTGLIKRIAPGAETVNINGVEAVVV